MGLDKQYGKDYDYSDKNQAFQAVETYPLDYARRVIREASQQLKVIGQNEKAEITDSLSGRKLQVKKLEGVDLTTIVDLKNQKMNMLEMLVPFQSFASKFQEERIHQDQIL